MAFTASLPLGLNSATPHQLVKNLSLLSSMTLSSSSLCRQSLSGPHLLTRQLSLVPHLQSKLLNLKSLRHFHASFLRLRNGARPSSVLPKKLKQRVSRRQKLNDGVPARKNRLHGSYSMISLLRMVPLLALTSLSPTMYNSVTVDLSRSLFLASTSGHLKLTRKSPTVFVASRGVWVSEAQSRNRRIKLASWSCNFYTCRGFEVLVRKTCRGVLGLPLES